jgi:hypothetical protein
MKILLATDGSDCSKAAVNAVAERPWPKGSKVKIISAIDVPHTPTTEGWVLPDSYYKDVEQATKAQAEAAIKDARQRLMTENVSELEIITETTSGSAGCDPDEARGMLFDRARIARLQGMAALPARLSFARCCKSCALLRRDRASRARQASVSKKWRIEREFLCAASQRTIF